MRVVLATHNPNKLREFRRMLPTWTITAVANDLDLPPETGATYEANAFLKARAVAATTDSAVLADDSGIEADELAGAPGIRSARFAGPAATAAENLAQLRAVVTPGSALRYVCVVVYLNGFQTKVVCGVCEGTMAKVPQGCHGFGYDPIFIPNGDPDRRRTMAQLSDVEKDALSHRGVALDKLRRWLGG